MKNLILITMFMITAITSAQCGVGCTISGSGTIPSNTIRTYSVTATSGYSYFWSVTGGLSIIGSNTGSSVSVRGTSNGTVYITKFRAGSAPCCASKNIGISSNACGLTISQITELNGLGSDNVAFFTVPTLQPGWTITSSSFKVTLNSGSATTYNGFINPNNGFPQIIIPVRCNPNSGRVDKVSVTVNATSGSNSCSRTVETDFFSVCGTGGIGIGFRNDIDKETFSMDSNSKETSVFDLNGNLKIESKNSSEVTNEMNKLPNGIYIVKTKNEKGEINTKKVVLKK